jgi:drug/metabolite transporter (DMT)-like permease
LPSQRDARGGNRLAYILVNIACLLWAGNLTLGRALRDLAGPYTLSAVRVALAGLLFLAFLPRLSPGDRSMRRGWPLLTGMALTGVAGFPILAYMALRFTTTTNAVLIQGAGPLVTALLAAIFLHTRLTRGQLIGAVLSLLGVAFIITGGRLETIAQFRFNIGDVLMVLSVLAWGLYSVMARVVTATRSTVSASAFSTWFALPLLIPLATSEWQTQPAVLDGRMIAAFLYIGVAAAFLAFLAWNEGVRLAGTAGAMAFYNMLPVYGAVLGAVFLGERLGTGQIAGGALVLTGGLVSALWPTAGASRAELETAVPGLSESAGWREDENPS